MSIEKPLIQALAIQNFRGFRSLDLKGLKPVNLIVGHNNTGKTSLLEGIVLLCDSPLSQQLFQLFRVNLGNPHVRYFPWLVRDGAAKEGANLACDTETFRKGLHLMRHGSPVSIRMGFAGPVNMGNIQVYKTEQHNQASPAINCKVVSVYQRDPSLLVPLIGKVFRKREGEDRFQKLLKEVDQRITKVRIDPGEDGNQVLVDVGLTEMLPLSQVGQGVYRLAVILADIIGDEPSILLIDEIENGLHHSVQKQVWTGLAVIAKELNVQIFATTHSGECLQAAHKAFQDRPSYDLGVIQLFRDNAGVQGRVLDKQHIEAAISADIELR